MNEDRERDRERRVEVAWHPARERELERNDVDGNPEIERLRTEAPRLENFTGVVKPCGPACRA